MKKLMSALIVFIFLGLLVSYWSCREQEVSGQANNETQRCDSLSNNIIPNQIVLKLNKPVDSIKITTIDSILRELDTAFGLSFPEIHVSKKCICNQLILIEADMSDVELEESESTAVRNPEDEGLINRIGFNRAIDVGPINPVLTPITFQFPEFSPFTLPKEPSPFPTVRLGIVDTGVDPYVDQITPFIWINPAEANAIDSLDSDENCLIDDDIGFDFRHQIRFVIDTVGHGTSLNGIITDSYPEEINLELLNSKFVSAEREADLFDAVCGMYYAMSKQADIINTSWGYYGDPSIILEGALETALDSGVLVVSSAGNDSLDVLNCNHWPSNFSCSFDNVISVGSIDAFDCDSLVALAGFSNFGNCVDFAAPGTNIESVAPGVATGPDALPNQHNLTSIGSGTSFAAAYVSRQASILLSENPALNPAALKELLIEQLRPIDSPGPHISHQGWVVPVLPAYDCLN